MKPVDYSQVNWTMHDAAIARAFGVTRAAVGRARKKAGAPPSQRPKIDRPPSLAVRRIMAWECCRLVAKLDDMGMEDVLPQWMWPSWSKLAEMARQVPIENSTTLSPTVGSGESSTNQ